MSPSLDVRPSRGLAFRLAFCILTSATLIFTAAFAYYYRSSKDMILAGVRENAKNLLRGAVYRIEAPLSGIERIPLFLARSLGRELPPAEVLEQSLNDFLGTNPDVFGTAAAFEPGAFAGLPRFAPYYCRRGDAVVRVPLGYEDYYELENWYLIPKQLGRPVWSEPYFDEAGGDIVMTTYSVPIMRAENDKTTFLGVVTADVSLDWLRRQVAKISLYHSGYAFLISRGGTYVSHPDNRFLMRESIFSLAEASRSPQLRTIGRRMIQGEEGFARLPDFILGKPAWLAFAPMPVTGWSMGVIVPEDELFADLRKLGREVAILGGAGFTVLLLVIAFIAATITRPLSRLAATASQIARGNLDTPVPVGSGSDEVGALSRSFEQMRLALRDYIADLTATTKAKERLESELKIARNIQMSFLPKKFPPFPDIDAFSLHADLVPAWEVGGDLYDFFLISPGRLLVLVGDVSGKGVPAALFMAVTKTLVKGIAEQESDPAVILTKVNRELCVDNESMLFVTMFLGILDFATGELTFSNAGHNPPARIAPDGTVSWLALPRGLFLGVMEDSVYRTATVTLAPGEKLVAFTDGVTEAMNPGLELFGTTRLHDTLAQAAALSPQALDEAIMQAVNTFAGEAEQADDITVLTLLYHHADGA
ncbi:Serine phosphatase RsbU, regulator of sigma subunit [Desulfovibrio sp. DV]|uniref:SpoIIE family protein phosphatase n=1 Tax=Desulfovibrio sp. DV TaxID=1844708 RepID=UPI00094B79DC|nr:SpoIIE family protein phosphatase [Desulfovibrio sp. DV]OLN25924.1 Serine phosphatase RsbU, regulator of sigma subunit [Desulfovibrio sp. DV]